MTIYRLDDLTPSIASDAWISGESTVIGDVTVASEVSVWPGAAIRGDNDRITIGNRVNIQEGAILHTDPGFVLEIEDNVSVGHQAMLHGCKVGKGSLIGIQAVVLNGVVIGRECLIGAGALVTSGTVVPDRSMVLGAPAKVTRQLADEEVARLAKVADDYAKRAAHYRNGLRAVQALPAVLPESDQAR
ncbi:MULTISPECIES: gamma carbonic anhydrase family protein [Paraburkholderia]|uniref:Gamma carbonic anhydrase family protein n=1 Tax=Paraburkholderia madseniana TaxID=2599607 RepID=A0AAP5BQ20_9BURK|nr:MULTISPECIES: gamma carbonic anhydrase family protein [Paraburkholderia]MCX4152053.1 gamma carbonic anhydrase family protein [Paraburkholderia madseniana]MDN7154981.1 gamma carbonic anhydrase family protein [Paraburkholderia sp. WS6]MDQ6413864.1 gamma carbonic anhydrase family protein [Paraburkholderia madseniana]